jgi:hypothetical protein
MMWVTTKDRLQSNVAAQLPGWFVAVPPEQADEFVTGKITRQSQAEITSSFTMCKRITGGAFPSSK